MSVKRKVTVPVGRLGIDRPLLSSAERAAGPRGDVRRQWEPLLGRTVNRRTAPSPPASAPPSGCRGGLGRRSGGLSRRGGWRVLRHGRPNRGRARWYAIVEPHELPRRRPPVQFIERSVQYGRRVHGLSCVLGAQQRVHLRFPARLHVLVSPLVMGEGV